MSITGLSLCCTAVLSHQQGVPFDRIRTEGRHALQPVPAQCRRRARGGCLRRSHWKIQTQYSPNTDPTQSQYSPNTVPIQFQKYSPNAVPEYRCDMLDEGHIGECNAWVFLLRIAGWPHLGNAAPEVCRNVLNEGHIC